MGFFDLKAICVNCNKEVGLNRYKIADGWICPDCFKKCGYTLMTPIKIKTIDDIKVDIKKREKQEEELSSFNATKKIGSFIEFDDVNRKWLIPDGVFGGKKNPHIYNYEDIVEYELLEVGGVGAIVGGVTGKKKSKSIINSLKIKITVNDFQNPTVYINLITTKTKADSFVYKTNYDIAQQILSTFALIQKDNNNQQDSNNYDETKGVISAADEILKFKNLLDSGVITQEEFEAKKKLLLKI